MKIPRILGLILGLVPLIHGTAGDTGSALVNAAKVAQRVGDVSADNTLNVVGKDQDALEQLVRETTTAYETKAQALTEANDNVEQVKDNDQQFVSKMVVLTTELQKLNVAAPPQNDVHAEIHTMLEAAEQNPDISDKNYTYIHTERDKTLTFLKAQQYSFDDIKRLCAFAKKIYDNAREAATKLPELENQSQSIAAAHEDYEALLGAYSLYTNTSPDSKDSDATLIAELQQGKLDETQIHVAALNKLLGTMKQTGQFPVKEYEALNKKKDDRSQTYDEALKILQGTNATAPTTEPTAEPVQVDSSASIDVIRGLGLARNAPLTRTNFTCLQNDYELRTEDMHQNFSQLDGLSADLTDLPLDKITTYREKIKGILLFFKEKLLAKQDAKPPIDEAPVQTAAAVHTILLEYTAEEDEASLKEQTVKPFEKWLTLIPTQSNAVAVYNFTRDVLVVFETVLKVEENAPPDESNEELKTKLDNFGLLFLAGLVFETMFDNGASFLQQRIEAAKLAAEAKRGQQLLEYKQVIIAKGWQRYAYELAGQPKLCASEVLTYAAVDEEMAREENPPLTPQDIDHLDSIDRKVLDGKLEFTAAEIRASIRAERFYTSLLPNRKQVRADAYKLNRIAFVHKEQVGPTVLELGGAFVRLWPTVQTAGLKPYAQLLADKIRTRLNLAPGGDICERVMEFLVARMQRVADSAREDTIAALQTVFETMADMGTGFFTAAALAERENGAWFEFRAFDLPAAVPLPNFNPPQHDRIRTLLETMKLKCSPERAKQYENALVMETEVLKQKHEKELTKRNQDIAAVQQHGTQASIFPVCVVRGTVGALDAAFTKFQKDHPEHPWVATGAARIENENEYVQLFYQLNRTHAQLLWTYLHLKNR